MTVVLRRKGSDDIAVDESQVDHFRALGYHAVRRPTLTDETAEESAAQKRVPKKAAADTPASTS